jgi:N4-gp56 family major capsid protein
MATLNMGLGGAAQTAGLAIQLKTTYNRTLLENARDKLVHQQFGREYTLPKRGGLTMEWRKADTLPVATTPLVEGTPPTEDTFGYTSTTVTIAQYGAFVKGTDIVNVVGIDPLLDNVTEEQGVQAGLTIETIDRDALSAGTNVRYADAVANRAAVGIANKLDANEIVIARRTMAVNKAQPVKGRFYAAIVHPFTAADLIQDTSIVAAMNSQAGASQSGTSLFDGELMRYMGVVFVESTMAKVFTGAGALGINVYSTLFFGKNAYGVLSLESMGMETIFHNIGSAGAADPLNQYWTHGWKTTHAIKILQQNYMLRVEHAASA